MEIIRNFFVRFIIWLLNNDEIKAALTKHVTEKVEVIRAKLAKLNADLGNADEN